MIVVFGSINVDFVTPVAVLPREGETVMGESFTLVPGGKGANQALAAARAGASVRLAGAVGQDHLAGEALALLKAEGVDLSAVATAAGPTGAAFIGVDAKGRNQIIVAAGANAHARADSLAVGNMGPGDILLLQHEVPADEGLAAAARAKADGARVLLNAAPAALPPPALWPLLDGLVVNEHEAAVIAAALGWADTDPLAIARRIEAEKGPACVVTLGAEGVIGVIKGAVTQLPAMPVTVVDTTAAGDAFVGAFAAALDGGRSFAEALRHGIAAGSLACTRAGAQTSLPRRAEIEALVAPSHA